MVSPTTPQASGSLYIGDLHPDVVSDDLHNLFSTIGQLSSVRICRDAITRKSLGYGYVNFYSVRDAERALDVMNYYSSEATKGRPLRIMWKHRDPSVRKSGQGNIFIKNLEKTVDMKMLNDIFSPYGSIMSCKVQTNEEGVSQGYGYVHFESNESATKAIEAVNGMSIEGKQVYVGPFQKRSDREATGQAHRTFTNVYIKYLDESFCSEEKLRELFSKFGEITSIYIPKKEDTEIPHGVAFVNFKEPDSANQAVEEMNETDVAGKRLYVSRAQKKPERDAVLRARHESWKIERLKKHQGINLFVKNLNDDIDDEQLKAIFAPYGEITSCKIMRDSRGNSKGFGFVCYANQADANKAVAELTGQMIGNKPIYVALAQSKEHRKAHLERLHAANSAAQPVYATQGAHIFYPQPGVPAQINPALAATAGRGVSPFLNHQYMMGRGAPMVAGRGFAPGGVPPMAGPYDMNNAGGMPGQRRGQGRQGPRGPGGAGRGGPPQGGRGRGGQAAGQQQIRYTATARNAGNPNVPQVPPQAAMAMPDPASQMPGANGQTPLTIEVLANASKEEQKQMLGERLYPLIREKEPQLAGKITGMIIEMDNAEILHLLESPEALNQNIKEALEDLREETEGSN